MKFNLKAVPVALAFSLIAVTGLSACNTVRGAGQDVQATGNAVSNTASEVQHDMNDGNPKTP
jgi:entericidin B